MSVTALMKMKKRENVIIRFSLVLVFCVSTLLPLWAGGSQEGPIRTSPDVVTKAQSGNNGAVEESGGIPVVLEVEEGEHFMHKMKLMLFIKVKNHPQMAAWCETPDGEFLSTLFITRRAGTQSWRGAPGDPTPKEDIRRKESLPVWAHRHGKTYADGLHLPTKEQPMPDAVSSATPKAGFSIETRLPEGHEEVWVYFEVNNSTDFNDTYGKDAKVDSEFYSGGPWGSGQPALVYGARVELSELIGAQGEDTARPVTLNLIGHSSPDGSTGKIYRETDGLTTALDIIDEIELRVCL